MICLLLSNTRWHNIIEIGHLSNVKTTYRAKKDDDTQTLSEFDKHHQSLLSDDVEEGWSSELRRYLGTMQRDVKKDTDIVEWWQVSIQAFVAHYPKLITVQ